jgi:endonuclease G
LSEPHNQSHADNSYQPDYYGPTPSDDMVESAPDNDLEPVSDNPSNCKNKLPYGDITSQLIPTQLIDICHSAYYAKFDPNAKIPLFTSYIINNKTIAGCYSKDNVRKPTPTYSRDPNTTADQSANKGDYQGSVYDHGHLAPASDLGYDKNVLYESYYYTNLAPQLHSFNAGRWGVLENSVRYWAFPQTQNGHQIQIIMGTLYNSASKKLKERVVIPDKFFKIIIDINNSLQVYAFSFPQVTTNNLYDYQTTITEIEKEYNINIPVSSSINKSKINNFIVPPKTTYDTYKANNCKNIAV